MQQQQQRKVKPTLIPTAMRLAFINSLATHPTGDVPAQVEDALRRRAGVRRHYKMWSKSGAKGN